MFRIDKKLLGIAMLNAGVKSGEDLAHLAGIGVNTVSRLQNGGRVKLATLQKLASALDVEPEELLAAEVNRA